MKTIIAATRTATERHVFIAIMSCPWRDEITAELCGMSKSDLHGARWARSNGILIINYPAQWAMHGKAAGPIRNQEMANDGDALIAAWDGKSRGTADMIRRAKAKGLRTHVFNYMTGEVLP